MQYGAGHKIHDPDDHRDQQRCYQHDHRRLLQLGPGRPGHLFQQLPVRLPEICRDFVHVDIHFFAASCLSDTDLARALGFEPRLKVLETSVLPLYYARMPLTIGPWPNRLWRLKAKSYPGGDPEQLSV
jgi:hypothetical protein